MERAVQLEGDVVLALHSSGWALGARAAPGVPIVAFTNGPPRWMGSPLTHYLRARALPLRLAARATLPVHGRVQRRLRARADVILASSRYAAALLPEPARVVYPPVDVERFTGPGDPDGHVIAVARLVAHKRIEVLLEAMRDRPERLVVVGTGPELTRMRAAAPANVEFAGAVDDAQLAALLGGARALVHPTFEEFGIVMAEALASGVPVIAPRQGGALEIVEDGRTGRLLAEVTPAAIGTALDDLPVDPLACREAAGRFGQERFLDELGTALDDALALAPSPAIC
jgi:glycosyltransferase involved in cell wall biosynthesis